VFVTIFAAEVVLQVVIVQYGGAVFNTHALNAEEWWGCTSS
jgi:hypothetical protein